MGTEWALLGAWGLHQIANCFAWGMQEMQHGEFVYCFSCGVGESVQSTCDVFVEAERAHQLGDHFGRGLTHGWTRASEQRRQAACTTHYTWEAEGHSKCEL